MSVEQNIRMIEALFSAHNAHDWERFFAFYADSFRLVSPAGARRSKSEFRESTLALAEASPGLKADIVHIFGQGDFVCVEYELRVGREDPLFGEGDQAASGTDRGGYLRLCSVFQMLGSRIIEEHAYYDESAPSPRPGQNSNVCARGRP